MEFKEKIQRIILSDSDRINRNIMEFKDEDNISDQIGIDGINRNIMEFKEYSARQAEETIKELIET